MSKQRIEKCSLSRFLKTIRRNLLNRQFKAASEREMNGETYGYLEKDCQRFLKSIRTKSSSFSENKTQQRNLNGR